VTKDQSQPPDHALNNRQSRGHLDELVSRLDAVSLRLPLGQHWTVAAGLLHLAFWDRFVIERWRHAARIEATTPQPVEDHTLDLINDALTPLLLVVPVELAATDAQQAAEAVDELIDALSQDAVAAIRAEGRIRLIDRSIHRREHLDELNAAISVSDG